MLRLLVHRFAVSFEQKIGLASKLLHSFNVVAKRDLVLLDLRESVAFFLLRHVASPYFQRQHLSVEVFRWNGWHRRFFAFCCGLITTLGAVH